MISTPQQLGVLIDELSSSTWTLAAIGTIFDSGLADHLREPRSLDELAAACPALSRERIARCLAVAAVRGVVVVEGARHRLAPGVLPYLEPAQRAVLRGDYRSNLLQPAAYLGTAGGAEASSGWRHTDPVVLQAQGDGSSLFASALKHHLIHELGDLAERLERPGARFLDVGVGVGALAISMCQVFPRLGAVGLDPFDAPLALARANVTGAALEDRIELRQIKVQDLTDQDAFDLAWLPTFFLGPGQVPGALARLRDALRPGGWLLTPTLNPAAGEAERAVWSLVFESWGGPVLFAPDAQALLAEAGLTSRTFPGPSWMTMVAAQRDPG